MRVTRFIYKKGSPRSRRALKFVTEARLSKPCVLAASTVAAHCAPGHLSCNDPARVAPAHAGPRPALSFYPSVHGRHRTPLDTGRIESASKKLRRDRPRMCPRKIDHDQRLSSQVSVARTRPTATPTAAPHASRPRGLATILLAAAPALRKKISSCDGSTPHRRALRPTMPAFFHSWA